jgi:glutathione S-transferase
MNQMTSGPLFVAKFMIDSFSTVRQREPPSKDKTTHIRLITISVSHYCEKVRWALDHLEARNDNPYYYTEDAHPPGLHAYETLKASNEVASITPMLLYEENGKTELLYDSSRILKRFMPELYPKEIETGIQKMEEDLGQRLGAAVRCFAYYHMLTQLDKYHETVVNLCADEAKMAKVESIVFDKFIDKGLASGLMEALHINEDTAAASLQELRKVFSELSKKLEESGGEYLMDDSNGKTYGFTAADLTFAALAYPILRPPEMRNWLPEMTALPDEINKLTKDLAATKAGQHVLKVYKKHRTATTTNDNFVAMKTAERNKYPWEGISLWWPVTLFVGAAASIVYTVAHSRPRE